MDSEDEELMDAEMDDMNDIIGDENDEDMDGSLHDNIGEDDEDEDLPELEPVGGAKDKNAKKDMKASKNTAKKKGSVIDDDFFKLEELEKFLDDADVSSHLDLFPLRSGFKIINI